METTRRSRRSFLGSLAAGAASIILLGRWLSPRKKAGARTVLLEVPKAELPEGGALVYRESRLAVVREGGDVYALSLVCTHLGCTVTVSPHEISCPCHGSVFDREGKVVKGPAARPLPRHTVEERGDALVVLA